MLIQMKEGQQGVQQNDVVTLGLTSMEAEPHLLT